MIEEKIRSIEEDIRCHKESVEKLSKRLEELKLSAKEEELPSKYIKCIEWLGSSFTKDKIYTQDDKGLYTCNFGKKTRWTSINHGKWQVPTVSEIESYLISEAEKKGFVKGAKVKHGKSIGEIDNIVMVTKLDRTNNSIPVENYFIKNGGNFLIIHSSYKFTVPLEECELIPTHPSIEISSYKVEFKEDHIKVGCRSIEAVSIRELNKAIKNFVAINSLDINSIDVGCGNKVTVKQIEEIAKHYQS
jgi:hypothetical protein